MIGVAGHITLRDPVEPDTFWVNPFGVAFSQIKASDLIRVNHEGQVIDGGEVRMLNAAAFMIHSAIHAARPDVVCAAHSHSLHGRAFCTLGRPLDIITQDSCAFYNVRLPSRAMCVSADGYRTTLSTSNSTASCSPRKKARILLKLLGIRKRLCCRTMGF
jgi:ribulose-5-phosphate 4-epimerase/fuculose-1-phosphate aldolase